MNPIAFSSFATRRESAFGQDDEEPVGVDLGNDEVASVQDLSVTFRRNGENIYAVRGVDLSIKRGEIVALVGESGSGKSVLALSLLGLIDSASRPEVSGSVKILGRSLNGIDAEELRELRRHRLGAIFQDPMTSLNPTMRIGKQLREVTESVDEVVDLLERVGIPQPLKMLDVYPFQLSGGLRQRVMIAMALAGRPALIIADEPTTALDVTVQAQILRLVKEIRDNFGTSFLFITHDLAVASAIADRVVVMYSGRVVERGSTQVLLEQPLHPYTRALLGSRLALGYRGGKRLPTLRGEAPDPRILAAGCSFQARCDVGLDACASKIPVLLDLPTGQSVSCLRYGSSATSFFDDTAATGDPPSEQPRALDHSLNEQKSQRGAKAALVINDLTVEFKVGTSGSRSVLKALRGVSLEVESGSSLVVVGESGSGKSTLLRSIAGLIKPSWGSIKRAQNTSCQMVFQDAGASLTPWMSVGELLDERLVAAGIRSKADKSARIAEALQAVGLGRQVLFAKAYQLSGGQRQRAALARAIVVPPSILLCDEPTSALDVSLAALVLNLIMALRERYRMTLIFVTHDLAVARVIADRIAVMYLGQVVETGSAHQILDEPVHPYTRSLLAAVPEQGKALPEILGEPASPLKIPAGCGFNPRCPVSVENCRTQEPLLKIFRDSHGHLVRCSRVDEGDVWQ
jgi:peptide/nickel transport system ATP-binding protein